MFNNYIIHVKDMFLVGPILGRSPDNTSILGVIQRPVHEIVKITSKARSIGGGPLNRISIQSIN
jgi:hypothetical protein